MATGDLTRRQQILVDLLAGGPRTTRELAVACGYRAGDQAGNWYASKTLARLARRGYPLRAIGRPGSHHGCLYLLVEQHDRQAPHCWRCGTILATDNGGTVCSPCERALVDQELAAVMV